jgi:hypothetical protein
MFSKNQFDGLDDIITTTVSDNYRELTLNWIANLNLYNLKDNIVIFCLDNEIYNCIIEQNVKAYKLLDNVIINDRGDWIELEKYHKATGPIMLADMYKKNILFSDVDVVFLKTPLDYFKSIDSDIIVTDDKRYNKFHLARKENHIITIQDNVPKDWGVTDQSKFGNLNGAVGYYRYNKDIIAFFKTIFAKENIANYPQKIEDGAAQTIFNDGLTNQRISVEVVSVFDFANGSLLDVPYLKKKVMESAVGIHYNYCDSDPYKGYREKIDKIKNDNFWYI